MDLKRTSKLINGMIKEGIIPGANIAVVNGTDIYTESFGNKALVPSVEANDISTLYDLASLTKAIVINTLLVRAIQNSLVDLNDDISYYLPAYNYLGITVYDLVTHTSGLPADFDIPNIHSNTDFEKQLRNIELERNPGEKVVYSCVGYTLLGMVLESAYEGSLADIAKKEVFKPLGMINTTFSPEEMKCAPTEVTLERGIVRGRAHDEKAYYSSKPIGAAGAFSDALDLSKFISMVLNDGMVDGQEYLKKEIIDMWFTPCEYELDLSARSIGWIVGENASVTGTICSGDTISHTGYTGTSLVIDRLNNIGFVLLTNSVHPIRENRTLFIPMRKTIAEAVYKDMEIGFQKKIQ